MQKLSISRMSKSSCILLTANTLWRFGHAARIQTEPDIFSRLPEIPPGFLTGGLPPTSITEQMAAAGILLPAGLPPVSTAGFSSAAPLV